MATKSSGGRFGWVVAAALAIGHVLRSLRGGGGGREGRGGSGVRERNDANAFILSVELELKTQAAADALVKAWGDAADWCRVNEPTLLHYEIAR